MVDESISKTETACSFGAEAIEEGNLMIEGWMLSGPCHEILGADGLDTQLGVRKKRVLSHKLLLTNIRWAGTRMSSKKSRRTGS